MKKLTIKYKIQRAVNRKEQAITPKHGFIRSWVDILLAIDKKIRNR